LSVTDQITPQQFHEADGVEDWRVVTKVACAHFSTGSFAIGVKLLDGIGSWPTLRTTIQTSTCGPRA
jgi:4a-hydroxytetrahydrobiopterin dehydratase